MCINVNVTRRQKRLIQANETLKSTLVHLTSAENKLVTLTTVQETLACTSSIWPDKQMLKLAPMQISHSIMSAVTPLHKQDWVYAQRFSVKQNISFLFHCVWFKPYKTEYASVPGVLCMCTNAYARPGGGVDLKVCDVEMKSEIWVIPEAKGDKQEARLWLTQSSALGYCNQILQNVKTKKHHTMTALTLHIQNVW